MTIKRLDHVSVVVDDLAAAVAFFTALGMTLEGEMPRNSSEAFTAFGDTAGALSATARATRPSPTAT
jgi:catechol 2,3-dioxygenase-like lactoylglutathione lyase family enzyme